MDVYGSAPQCFGLRQRAKAKLMPRWFLLYEYLHSALNTALMISAYSQPIDVLLIVVLYNLYFISKNIPCHRRRLSSYCF